ncbi:MAG: hypothetical protein KJZ75_08225 [Hyphomonadaceae bacterium]|nr:hypothetical protein [Hyphomonadaceae bacterium]
MLIEKRKDGPRMEGLRPVGKSLDLIVKNLRAPLDLKAPRKLEPAK